MANTYSIKFRGAQTSQANDAAMDGASTTFRSLDRAQKAASQTCRAYLISAEIYDAHGSLVLRVDSSGEWRAP